LGGTLASRTRLGFGGGEGSDISAWEA